MEHTLELAGPQYIADELLQSQGIYINLVHPRKIENYELRIEDRKRRASHFKLFNNQVPLGIFERSRPNFLSLNL